MNEQRTSIDETNDDGGNTALPDPMLVELKCEVDRIRDEAKAGLWMSHVETDVVRYAQWDHQSPDGLKHASANSNEPVTPFEGSTDNRVRLTDMVNNEDVMLVVVSTLRAQMSLRGFTAKDAKKAGNMEIVLRYFIRNVLREKYVIEMIKAAQYSRADSPCVALVKMIWATRNQLSLKEVTAAELAKIYVDQALEGADMNDPNLGNAVRASAAEFMSVLQDPLADEAALADWLILAFPHLKKPRAKKVISALRKDGKAEFPIPIVSFDGPEMEAKRLFEDWYCSVNAPTDFQRVPIWFESQWLYKSEVIERKTSEGWDEKFVDSLVGVDGKVGFEGVSAFPEYVRTSTGEMKVREMATYKGMYNVLIAYFTAVNEDGIPGRYYVTLNRDVDVAAHERRLVNYPHGKWPATPIMREVLTSRMMDGRGLTELNSVWQSLIKLNGDLTGDNAIIGGLPPLKSWGRGGSNLYLAPLLEIPLGRTARGDLKWMEPPAQPKGAQDMIAEYRQQVNEYNGRPGEGVDPSTVALHQSFKVLVWNWQWREVINQLVQLIQAYAPEDVLDQVTDSDGKELHLTREDIAGQYHAEIVVDPRTMDPEYMTALGKFWKNILLAIDTNKRIDTSGLVEWLAWMVSPEIADTVLRSLETANSSEIEDEIKAFLQISAGIEPDLPDDGSINYALRLSWYQNQKGKNPMIYSDLKPVSQQILKSRIERLEMLSKQYGENAQIGRQGGRTALPEASTVPAEETAGE